MAWPSFIKHSATRGHPENCSDIFAEMKITSVSPGHVSQIQSMGSRYSHGLVAEMNIFVMFCFFAFFFSPEVKHMSREADIKGDHFLEPNDKAYVIFPLVTLVLQGNYCGWTKPCTT